MAKENLLEALDHFAQALALFAQAGTSGESGVAFEPRNFDADDAARYCGIGKTKLFELKNAGKVKTVMVCGRPKYIKKSLDSYLDKLEKG